MLRKSMMIFKTAIFLIAFMTSMCSYAHIVDSFLPSQHVTGWLKSINLEDKYYKIVLAKFGVEYTYFVDPFEFMVQEEPYSYQEKLVDNMLCLKRLAATSPEQKEYISQLISHHEKYKYFRKNEKLYRHYMEELSATGKYIPYTDCQEIIHDKKEKRNLLIKEQKEVYVSNGKDAAAHFIWPDFLTDILIEMGAGELKGIKRKKEESPIIEARKKLGIEKKLEFLINYLDLLPAITAPYYDLSQMLQLQALSITLEKLEKEKKERPYILLEYSFAKRPGGEGKQFISIKNIEKIVPLHLFELDPIQTTAELIAWNAYITDTKMYESRLFFPPIAQTSVFSDKKIAHIVDEQALEELKTQGGKGQYQDVRITEIQEYRRSQEGIDSAASLNIPNETYIFIREEGGKDIPVYTNDLSLIEFAKLALKADMRIIAVTFKSEEKVQLISLGLSFQARFLLGNSTLLSAISSRTNQPVYDFMTSAMIENLPEKEEAYQESTGRLLSDKDRASIMFFEVPLGAMKKNALTGNESQEEILAIFVDICRKINKLDAPYLKTYQINKDRTAIAQLMYGFFYQIGVWDAKAENIFDFLTVYLENDFTNIDKEKAEERWKQKDKQQHTANPSTSSTSIKTISERSEQPLEQAPERQEGPPRQKRIRKKLFVSS